MHSWELHFQGALLFGQYWLVGIGLLVAFSWAYMRFTPYDELALVRNGLVAPAVSLSGALLGFCLPVFAAIQHSASIPMLALWASFSLLVQCGAYWWMHLVYADLTEAISKDRLAPAIFLATCSVALGLLNAACLTP